MKSPPSFTMALCNTFIAILVLFLFCSPPILAQHSNDCMSVDRGYQCKDRISHFLGQYAPWFTVKSEIPDEIPSGCKVTLVNLLARHGARYPTTSKGASYNATIQHIQTSATAFEGRFGFLQNYVYNLGAENLTAFGAEEMVDSGIQFYKRYRALASKNVPFIRASGEQRVVDSATNFSLGFHDTRMMDPKGKPDNYPYPVLVIPEGPGENNTLNHDLCTTFENGTDSTIGASSQAIWAGIFAPPIQARVNDNLPGANLSTSQVISLMDMCSFDTVANSAGTLSPFCHLFKEKEWKDYDYYQSLGKYYGYGSGNPLGPTQGVGFTNELIARMTDTAVMDHTSVNQTLDASNATFPLGIPLYADFSHDNDLTPIFAAMGLYNLTAPLSNTTYETIQQTNQYSAAYTVPFAARAFFEKMECTDYTDELVRIIVNGRVIPLLNCGADELGRCTLSSWVESMSFAEGGGYWDQCFPSSSS